MEKGAKFKNFYSRPRLGVFKNLTHKGDCVTSSPVVTSVKYTLDVSFTTGNSSDNTAPSDEDTISEEEPRTE